MAKSEQQPLFENHETDPTVPHAGGYDSTTADAPFDQGVGQKIHPEAEEEAEAHAAATDLVERVTLASLRLGVVGRWPAPGQDAPEGVARPVLPSEEKDRRQALHNITIDGDAPDPLAPRPSNGQEQRNIDKAERRRRKAFRASAEVLRIASTVGRTPGTRTPFLERGSAAPGPRTRQINPGTGSHDLVRSGQELARPNRFGRQSDVGTDVQLARLDHGDYSRAERRMEMKNRRRYLAYTETRDTLNASNRAQRDGTNTFRAKLARLKNRAKLTLRMR